MIQLIYTLFTSMAFPFLKKKLRKRFGHSYIQQRLFKKTEQIKQYDIIIHAASVGEQNLVTPLVKELLQNDRKILLTAATDTGLGIGEKHFSKEPAVDVEYLPFDLFGPVRRFFKFRKAKQLILVETEIWPNTIIEANKNNMAVKIINGRISDKAFPGYLKAAILLKPVLKRIDLCLVRNETDRDRYKAIGIPDDRITISGNLKLAGIPDFSPISVHTDAPLIVIGSTREHEEKMIMDALAPLVLDRKINIIIAPRHPERCYEVADICRKKGISTVMSKNNTKYSTENIMCLIVNETGKLMSFYHQSSLCFVGGSLVPLGGQNFIEPLQLGKPVITGPHLENFQDILPAFKNAVTIADSPNELKDHIEQFLNNAEPYLEKAELGKTQLKKEYNSMKITLEALLC